MLQVFRDSSSRRFGAGTWRAECTTAESVCWASTAASAVPIAFQISCIVRVIVVFMLSVTEENRR